MTSNMMIEKLEERTFLSASMVKDINTAPSTVPGLWTWVGAGNTVYLSQDDGVAGWELWKTDGTPGGTVMIKDIRPGRDNSAPGWLTSMGDGTIFFAADDGTHGTELWKSDGTEAGTYLVKDINPGVGASSPGSLCNVNGTLYFSANDGVNGAELWKSDGSELGTVIVKNIATAAGVGSSPTQLINNNGTLFFRASDGFNGFELWKSDGSSIGTTMIKDIATSSSNGVNNVAMAVLNGYVYFSGFTSTNGSELWRSDGSPGNTQIVSDTTAGSSSSSPNKITASGSNVYFTVASTPSLWRTNGTTTGNVLLGSTFGITDVNGTLFFGSGTTLYSTIGDGTVNTVKTGLTMDANYWTNGNGTLYFPADGGDSAGDELWKSNGSGPGTERVKDVETGAASSTPFAMTPYGPGGSSGVIFAASTSATGAALYTTDGSDPGTSFLKDPNISTTDSGPLLLTAFNGKVYFLAFEAAYGNTGGELYRSDGTAAGTGIFVDLFPGPTGGSVSSLKVFNNYLYFAGNDGSGIGKELWRTDGTSVSLVKNINPGANGSSPGIGVVSGNYMFFDATTDIEGEELWRTDGTDTGTIRLTNLASGSYVDTSVDVGGWLYYTVFNSSNAFTGMFKTDGNSVVPITTTGFTGISSMLNIGGTLFISGTTSANGAELFKMGPADVSPVLVRDINTSGSSSPANFTNVDGTLFFSASTSANGVELWKSDGTTAGTVLVKDIQSGSSSSSPQSMVAANGVAYFRANDGVNGTELWRSDGTTAGTYLLKDITPPGATGGSPTRLFAANGFVYFAAGDDNSGNYDAWRSDGTPQGTVMISHYPKGSFFLQPSNAAFWTALNGDVYYRFTDETHGAELWKADQPDFATLGGGGALTVAATGNNDVIDITSGPSGVIVTLDGLTKSFAAGAVSSIQLLGKGGRDTVNVNAGSIAFTSDAGTNTNLTLRIAAGASATFNASQHLAGLELNGGNAVLSSGGGKVLVTSALTITGGSLDLGDGSLIFHSTAATRASDAAALTAKIKSGFNLGGGTLWSGSGITTTLGGNGTSNHHALGIAINDLVLAGGGSPGPIYTTFAGETVGVNDVLVKYTLFGDADVSGAITSNDYFQIDTGFLGNRMGWINGDFDYDGAVTSNDYFLIDTAFLSQSSGAPASISAAPAASTSLLPPRQSQSQKPLDSVVDGIFGASSA